MAAAVKPDIVLESCTTFGRVETQGEFTAGSVFFNKCSFVEEGKDNPNTIQLLEINHEEYIQMLADSIKN
jgi:inosine-uridine nucleoside N-ribohydrolase